jgi:hypothetical protein
MTDSLSTPVLFLIFNRPDTTQQVFNEIRKTQPAQLFVAADGPSKADYELCKKTRDIIQQVDWDCKVSTLFRDKNLGCKYAVSSAIDWFFSNVDEGIILEDDCVPDQSFFPFCQELLEKYRDDKRIMMISGANFQFDRKKTENSYYFSRYFHIWGWATWKRAWKLYDRDLKAWPEIREKGYLNNILSQKRLVRYWETIFNAVSNGSINTWDYQWVFSCWIQGGLSIIPNINMISNIGFDQRSTHTKGKDIRANMQTEKIVFPLRHPKYIIRNVEADRFTERIEYSRFGFIKSKLYGISLNACRRLKG